MAYTLHSYHFANNMSIWVFPKIRGTPKSSILIGFSIINHPFWGTPIFGNTHMFHWVYRNLIYINLDGTKRPFSKSLHSPFWCAPARESAHLSFFVQRPSGRKWMKGVSSGNLKSSKPSFWMYTVSCHDLWGLSKTVKSGRHFACQLACAHWIL